MRKSHAIILMILGFSTGGWIGYALVPPRSGPAGARSVRVPESGLGAGHPETSSAPRGFRAEEREPRPVIRRDGQGNFLLPEKLAERFRYMVFNGMKVNRQDMAVMGLDEGQMDRLQQLADEAFQRFVERTKPGIRDFTSSDDEMVWKVTGDPAATAADQVWMRGQIRGIIGTDSPLLENGIFGKLAYMASVHGGGDYFIRISRPEGQKDSLHFENLRLLPRDGVPLPQPGDSFHGYQDRYLYSSEKSFGGTQLPDHLAPLLEGKDWKRLRKKPAATVEPQ